MGIKIIDPSQPATSPCGQLPVKLASLSIKPKR